MIVKTDIDIDTKNRNDLLNLIKHTPAGIVKDDVIKTQHRCLCDRHSKGSIARCEQY